jgi:hypothetical protein
VLGSRLNSMFETCKDLEVMKCHQKWASVLETVCVPKLLQTQLKIFCSNGVKEVVELWTRHIKKQGNYIEKKCFKCVCMCVYKKIGFSLMVYVFLMYG